MISICILVICCGILAVFSTKFEVYVIRLGSEGRVCGVLCDFMESLGLYFGVLWSRSILPHNYIYGYIKNIFKKTVESLDWWLCRVSCGYFLVYSEVQQKNSFMYKMCAYTQA